MGSRKDILKNLGIPEYPWSSDDEDPPTDPRPPPTTQSRSAAHQSTASTSSSGTSGRSHVQARELFFSLLTQSGPRSAPTPYTPSTSSSRSDDIPLAAYLSRSPHTPAAELREPARRGDLDIQRVLAFKRLTRNINNGRYSRYAIQRGNPRPGSVVPSENHVSSNPNIASFRISGFRRVGRSSATSHSVPARHVNPNHGHSQSRQSAERRRRTHSMEVHNSDDEPDDTIAAEPRAAPSAPAAEDSPAEPEVEAEAQVSSNNTSGTGASLEEDIVEIVDDAALDMALIDRTRVKPSTSGDTIMASTSRADETDAPEQQNHGMKRKRSQSADEKSSDPCAIKDLNPSLLRLLECPVCLEWMEPPMSQCRRGHLVCSRCRARLASCPVCRTTFSSVRNRAMEGVAEMLRYPCRHGCGREVRLRRRAPHEASCAARKYLCPARLCADKVPLPRDQLAEHFHSKHLHLLKLGARHHFGIKVSSEAHDNWVIMALDEFFHMKVDVDIRTWGIIVYVAYIGPKCNAVDFAYEVTIDGQHNSRRMQYRRATHSDLESSSLTVSRQDCFHLTLDQALNFIRFKNRHCDAEKFLEFDVEITKVDPPPSHEDSDA